MKKILSLIALAVSLALLLMLTSCGGSFFAAEELNISSISSELLSDGSTKIIIAYTDESIVPDEFIIPCGKAGEVGADGNGIREITYSYNDKTSKTDIVISFTDATMAPVSFSVPDGVSVTEISERYDEITNEKYIIFTYSDGTTSAPIYLPSGKDGADGNGIKNFTKLVNADKSTYLCFELDDGRKCEIDIPAPQQGNGIKSMLSRTEDDGYYIDVIYDNGNTEVLSFERPTQWLRGSSSPSNIVGANGDYFFDTAGKIIYMKFNNSWVKIVDFADSKISCTVTFNLNDNSDAVMSGDNIFFIDRGEYFISYGYTVPVPTREGYTFLGWYTTRTASPNPTMGCFTDLTPVMSDLTLYAAWSPN